MKQIFPKELLIVLKNGTLQYVSFGPTILYVSINIIKNKEQIKAFKLILIL